MTNPCNKSARTSDAQNKGNHRAWDPNGIPKSWTINNKGLTNKKRKRQKGTQFSPEYALPCPTNSSKDPAEHCRKTTHKKLHFKKAILQRRQNLHESDTLQAPLGLVWIYWAQGLPGLPGLGAVFRRTPSGYYSDTAKKLDFGDHFHIFERYKITLLEFSYFRTKKEYFWSK